MRRVLVIAAVVAGATLATACSTSVHTSGVNVQMLAQGPLKRLPAAKSFLSILEFRQVPGGDFGPHAHQASIEYMLSGTDTISFRGVPSQSVGPGAAVFIPALVVHTHQNPDGRIGAGAIAVGLIALAVVLCAATLLRGRRRGIIVVGLSLLLIGGSVLPVIGATSDDYYLMAVRPESQRTAPMPRPDGHVVFAAPDLNPTPAAPYIETLTEITLPAGGRYDVPAVGPRIIIVLVGTAAVQLGGQTTSLGVGDTTFGQAGQSLAIVNGGSDALRVLDFTLTSTAGPPT
jgi:quercetin dioxygenase-like cupin family protein